MRTLRLRSRPVLEDDDGIPEFDNDKQQHAPKAPVGEYRKMPELGSQEYAKTRRKVDRYHEITHRSKELIESDILVNPGLNLQPGDTRMMSPCRVCDMNQIVLSLNRPTVVAEELTSPHADAFKHHLGREGTMQNMGYSQTQCSAVVNACFLFIKECI